MGAKILVIEDNAANLDLLVFLLRTAGHEPLAAADGREALERASEHELDLILCDLQLPVMDGYELIRRLRAKPRLHNIPFIAVTAFAMPGDHDRAINAGCDGYLPKPIDPEQFVAIVDRFLPPEKRSSATEIAVSG